jgi:adenylate cyclase
METRPRILVVDDLESGIDLLEALLVPRGYDVLRATSGEAALEVVHQTPPDLVLLDVLMPGMDGYTVCQRLRADAATRFLPVVMVTASHDQAKARGIDAGADDFIEKPIDHAELLARVASLLRIKEYHDTIEAQSTKLAEWNRELETRVSSQVDELARVSRLRRFLSPRLADVLVSMDGESLLDTHRTVVAVVCCQLLGFPAFAEIAAPEEVLELLSGYYAALGKVIRRVEGTVGALDEDRLTIFFGDPVPSEDPAGQAVSLALAMRDHVAQLSRNWRKRGLELHIGIGIDLGYATLGTFGLEGRLEYGAIGLVGRVAEGLCHRAQAGEILVSRRAHAALNDHFAATPVGEVELEGFLRPVEALSVHSAVVQDHSVLSGERTRLSARELEVLELVARGLTNHEIAEQLVVSERTAEAHVAHICAKLNLRSRVQAAAWAIEHGLVHAPLA